MRGVRDTLRSYSRAPARTWVHVPANNPILTRAYPRHNAHNAFSHFTHLCPH